jgi:hypothetical protein
MKSLPVGEHQPGGTAVNRGRNSTTLRAAINFCPALTAGKKLNLPRFPIGGLHYAMKQPDALLANIPRNPLAWILL